LVAIPSIPKTCKNLKSIDMIWFCKRKDESDRLEGLRVYAIKTKLKGWKRVVKRNWKFKVWNISGRRICSIIKSTNFDFAELISMKWLMKNKRIELAVINIKKLESQRIDEAKIEAKLNQIIIDG
jgi:hypothetical protein